MPTRSSILAWKIPWTEEPGGLQSMGPQGIGQDLSTKQQTSFFEKNQVQKGLDLPKQIEMKFRSPNSIFLAVWSSLIVVHRFSCGMHMRS